jgi:dienelactone hydrolase
MKWNIDKHTDCCVLIFSLLLALAWPCTTMGGASEKEYDPPSGRGPLVILLSGASGLERYLSFAADISRLGYYAILFDGNTYALNGDGNLREAIEKAQRSPKALPGKVAVIGFSKGGGGALAHAASMPDFVSTVIAYYPQIDNVPDMRGLVSQFKVPILVLAGQLDNWFDCCLIESMKHMETAAKEGGKSFELVVYPEANHMFNLENQVLDFYRADDAADAWQRTTKMLGQYQPLR